VGVGEIHLSRIPRTTYVRQMQLQLREKNIGYKKEFIREILQGVSAGKRRWQ
jgi:hypothetical protein